MNKIQVIFVCLGNICRSPMAEGVFRHLVADAGLADRFTISSAGTGNWHVGEAAHPGTRAILKKNGIAYRGRAQQLRRADVTGDESWVIVMDNSNLRDVRRLLGDRPQLYRLLDFARAYPGVQDVPDPYYTGGFQEVYDMVLDGCRGLLAEIRQKEGI